MRRLLLTAFLAAGCGPHQVDEGEPIARCPADPAWSACICVKVAGAACFCRAPSQQDPDRLCWRPR